MRSPLLSFDLTESDLGPYSSIASCTVQVRVKGATKIVDEGVLRPFFAGLGTVKHVVVLGQKVAFLIFLPLHELTIDSC